MATSDIFRAPVGTKDVFGEESRSWEYVLARFAHIARTYNYDLVVTPTFENYEVFSRLGEDSDVVSKEMYDFYDKGERHIALRPEGTAGIVRAFAQHRPLTPFKAWYVVSNFRYERPQKGRLREHHQVGVEVLGIDDPLIDVEVIQFAHEFLTSCGLTSNTLSINSLGDSAARAEHMQALIAYFEPYKEKLGGVFAERVTKNPFRMLDTKVVQWREVVEGAPSITDFLNDDSQRDFALVQQGLTDRGIDYTVTPSLVRGLDYYTNTAFEFISGALDAAQSTICGGGRYNSLVSQMDGPETPGIGFGLGIERLLLACEAEGVTLPVRTLDVYIVDLVQNEKSHRQVRDVETALRSRGLSVDKCFGKKSIKSAMKSADRSGASHLILLGESELENSTLSIKDMDSGAQSEQHAATFVDNPIF